MPDTPDNGNLDIRIRALVARARLYARAGWGMVQNATRTAHALDGNRWERRVLGSPATVHCPDCPPLAAQGWQPIGMLPPIGATRCRHRCYCHYLYTRSILPPS